MAHIETKINAVVDKHAQPVISTHRKLSWQEKRVIGDGNNSMKETLNWRTKDPMDNTGREKRPLVEQLTSRPRFQTTLLNDPDRRSYEWSWMDTPKPKRQLPHGFALCDGSNDRNYRPTGINGKDISNSADTYTRYQHSNTSWGKVNQIMGRQNDSVEKLNTAEQALQNIKVSIYVIQRERVKETRITLWSLWCLIYIYCSTVLHNTP